MKTSIVLPVLALAIVISSPAQTAKPTADNYLHLAVVSGSDQPLIKPGDPGTEGIWMGLEGGTAIKQDGVYHLFTAETMREPLFAHMRLGHWSSTNGTRWTRMATLFESDGDYTGKSTRASLWSPMPVYNEEEKRWNLFYVAYRAKPNDKSGWYLGYDGRIWRAASQTPDQAGLGGPYADVEIVLQPGTESQPWEGLQGVDSFFPFRVGKKWYAFYGTAHTELPLNMKYPKWTVGLAEAPRLAGPWKRCKEGNPVILNPAFTENPVVTRLADGTYVAVIDGGGHWGYGVSPDGCHWSLASFPQMTPPLKPWWRNMRTPLSLIKEDDGTYTVFFTAFIKDSPFGGLGKVSVRAIRK
jgi:hypothetical protein